MALLHSNALCKLCEKSFFFCVRTVRLEWVRAVSSYACSNFESPEIEFMKTTLLPFKNFTVWNFFKILFTLVLSVMPTTWVPDAHAECICSAFKIGRKQQLQVCTYNDWMAWRIFLVHISKQTCISEVGIEGRHLTMLK